MKITQKTVKAEKLARLFRWTAFVAAFACMLALVAVMTGWGDGKLVQLAPSANEAWQCYAVNNADMSVIFNVW